MPGAYSPGLSRTRLGAWLAVFFLALAVPSAVLVLKAYGQLKWEAFHQHRLLAEELAGRIDARLAALVDTEARRPFTEYAFVVESGAPGAGFRQRSPLSAFPVAPDIPGLVGHFQVDGRGALSTPLLPGDGIDPGAFGVDAGEGADRAALAGRIREVLSRNRLVDLRAARAEPGADDRDRARRDAVTTRPGTAGLREADDAGPTPEPAAAAPPAPAEEQLAAQAAFDRLESAPARQQRKALSSAGSLGRVGELKLEAPFADRVEDEARSLPAAPESAPSRKVTPARQQLAEAETAADQPTAPIATFENELDPFELSLLGSGHFVLYRKVWRDGQRYIQGVLIEQRAFLEGAVEAAFRGTTLARMSHLAVAWQEEVLAAFGASAGRRYLSSAEELAGTLLHRTRLSAPLSDLELVFTITRLPAGPGAKVIGWASAALGLVLCGGFLLMYRLGARQIDLTRQQRDFVSAVSHELRTPLTSIRMYGEILREGWASEEKKRAYYDYIHDESERLSRLIANVLQLARMSRNELQVELRRVGVEELLDGVRSKVSAQVERAGFELRVEQDPAAGGAAVAVDPDAFSQILINLVDNALKFSARAETRVVEIGCHLDENRVVFSVRDFGPGVPRDQRRRVFGLFYRAENELTRESVGTGIGLALVSRLAAAMKATVEVRDARPGACFSVSFPRARGPASASTQTVA